jgi:D-alanine-D-alanine ligase
MKIAILHDSVSAADAPDAQDVIAQADAVSLALKALGHKVFRLACTQNLAALQAALRRGQIDGVFNLVESINGQGRLIHLPLFCLDAMNLPYTGARAETMLLTSNKILAKRWMAAAGISTPAWVGPWPGTVYGDGGASSRRGTWIVKSVWEHASIGLGSESLVENAVAGEVLPLLEARAGQLGGTCFAERFIAGREFNLSLLAGPAGPEVLPPAEIVFEGFTDDMPRIVDYRAKWDADAYAYHHTPRRFDFEAGDNDLLSRLKTLARQCWDHFEGRGYARVDFRVDDAGRIWVLEINANPCLAPDAGFAAALERAGIPYREAVARILADGGLASTGSDAPGRRATHGAGAPRLHKDDAPALTSAEERVAENSDRLERSCRPTCRNRDGEPLWASMP